MMMMIIIMSIVAVVTRIADKRLFLLLQTCALSCGEAYINNQYASRHACNQVSPAHRQSCMSRCSHCIQQCMRQCTSPCGQTHSTAQHLGMHLSNMPRSPSHFLCFRLGKAFLLHSCFLCVFEWKRNSAVGQRQQQKHPLMRYGPLRAGSCTPLRQASYKCLDTEQAYLLPCRSQIRPPCSLGLFSWQFGILQSTHEVPK